MFRLAILAAIAAIPAAAQALDLKALDALADRASEAETVTLDSDKLRLAAAFLSFRDADQARVKRLITGVTAIAVRSFEFDKNGEYSSADLESLRFQLRGSGWSKIVEVKERHESAEIHIHTTGGKMTGLAIVTAEPRELTVVNIVGSVDLEDLSELGGSFGIPPVPLIEKKKPGAGSKR